MKCKCNKRSYYNLPGLRPRYCNNCKTDDMINVVNKKCIQCTIKYPCFNLEGLPKLYCRDCKTNDMINVNNKKCIQCKIKRPTFNLQGLKPLYCIDCKTAKMIDVVSKKCIQCKIKQPNFNLEGLPKLYCNDCKTDDMIDVVSKRCIQCNLKQPTFNLEGLPKLYCRDCKTDDMINVHNKKCIQCNIKIPHFNLKGLRPLYCGDCKTDKMVDVKNNKCKTCSLFQVKSKEDECFTCRRGPKIIRHETIIKEQLELSILKNYSSYDISHPCSNEMGIRKIRPDFTWETEKNIMILEVDENAHRLYNVECEQGRIHELHELFQKPLILVRYNPDAKMSILNQSNKKEHSYLIQTLENIIHQDKFDGLTKKGNEEIKVIYIGYKEERINELWDYIESVY